MDIQDRLIRPKMSACSMRARMAVSFPVSASKWALMKPKVPTGVPKMVIPSYSTRRSLLWTIFLRAMHLNRSLPAVFMNTVNLVKWYNYDNSLDKRGIRN